MRILRRPAPRRSTLLPHNISPRFQALELPLESTVTCQVNYVNTPIQQPDSCRSPNDSNRWTTVGFALSELESHGAWATGGSSLSRQESAPANNSVGWRETFALHVVYTATTRAKVSHLFQYDSCCTAVRVLTHPHWAPAIEHRRTRPVAYGEALLAIQRRMLSISFTASSACSVSPVEGTRRPS